MLSESCDGAAERSANAWLLNDVIVRGLTAAAAADGDGDGGFKVW